MAACLRQQHYRIMRNSCTARKHPKKNKNVPKLSASLLIFKEVIFYQKNVGNIAFALLFILSIYINNELNLIDDHLTTTLDLGL